ncbi:MAG: 2-oxo acid dehydrogenase subunit E2 [Gemmatimonadetes bacterium]|nr:2-oxo acid dehydrogenase subunit E2 [Gemmatimonadota bacterium]
MPKIEVPMPQMGESIAEGTVSRWLKQPGDAVERDEPILEISTDKVDAEIPAPAAGTLVDIQVQEGETVEVGTVVAFIDTEAKAGAAAGGGAAPAAPKEEEAAEQEEAPAPETGVDAAGDAEPVESRREPARQSASAGNGAEESADERLRRRSTPLVRRIAEEHDVDLTEVEGSGRAGRVTKQDIMSFLDQREKAPAEKAAPSRAPARQPAPAGGGAMGADQLWDLFYGKVQHPEFPAREGDDVKPMDRIRKLTADHMVLAKRVAPHVHSFIEIDFTRVDRIRRKNKPKWEQQGNKVSYTAFVAWSVAKVLPEFPMVNGTVSGDNLILRGSINIGIAVDLNPGLIVPVVRDADDLTLVGLAKRIGDLAGRARDRKLKPDEIQGASFSITNPGVLGTYVGMPIIPEGTSAILGTGSIEKRPVVVEADGVDSIAIRLRSMFSLGYDHRIVDGADAARFLARLKEVLETFPEEVA